MNQKLVKLLAAVVTLVGLFLLVGFLYFKQKSASLFSKELTKSSNASLIFSTEGELLGKNFEQNRILISEDEIPSHLVNALVVTEDERFFIHHGVDFIALTRVFFKTILLGKSSSGGGSTISQQLVKNIYGRDAGGSRLGLAKTKILEMFLASKVESEFTKNEIIVLYLNTVPFGEECFGVEAAANRFFNKKAINLNLNEAASLIAILKGNTIYNPRRHPHKNLERRNLIIDLMQKSEYLSLAEASELKATPLVLKYNPESALNHNDGYIAYQIKIEAQKILKELDRDFDLKKDGLKIYSTVNGTVQKQAALARKNHLKKLQVFQNKYWSQLSKSTKIKGYLNQQGLNETKPRLFFSWDSLYYNNANIQDSIAAYLNMLHAAVVVLDNQTGAVRSWIGGNNFAVFPYDLVKAQRPAASTIKPFVFLSFLADNHQLTDWLENKEIDDEQLGWNPKNSDGTFGGYYSVTGALALSKNIPTINAWRNTNFDTINKYHKLFFKKEIKDLPSAALGTENYSLLELAKAYGTLANGGLKVEPYLIDSILDSENKLIYSADFSAEKERIVSKNLTQEINYALNKTITQGTAKGFNPKAKEKWAAKTGTAQNNTDALFIAYNYDYTIAVKVLTYNPAVNMQSYYASGASAALPIANEIISVYPISNSLLFSKRDSLPLYRDESFMEKLKDKLDIDQSVKKDKQKRKKGLLKKIFGNKSH
jgi:penicillin-binding protein 1A